MPRTPSTTVPRVFDLDAYLERIGLDGRPDIATLHRAHVTSIPFENLDPQRGIAVSLAVEDLQRKLVGERRGGYCFEHNLLLKAALEALGAEVDMLLARVRRGASPGELRPRSHLVLRVRDGAISWHADVGFGGSGLLEPLPFGPGEAEQSGWRFRVAKDGPELVLQMLGVDGWQELYGFVPEPVPMVDVETSNWFVCTHPRSPFVTGIFIGARSSDGVLTQLTDWGEPTLTEQTPTASNQAPLEREAIPRLLASSFSLPGFVLGADGRVHPLAQ